MSQQVIKKTQETLGKYVTKPPLTEKLLGKPPFRYLHDILNVVINDHGFLKGLYTEDELKSDHVKDKDAKIAFLEKWINATSLAVGENLDIRPSKIVSGHEADNTNLLLQATAKGIEKKIDSSKAVKQVLSQPKGTKKESKEKTKEKTDSKKEKPSNKEKTSTRSKGSKVPTTGPPQDPKKGSKDPSKPTKGSEDPVKPSKGSRDPSKATIGAKAPPKVEKKKTSSLEKDTKSQDKTSTRDKRDGSKSKLRTTKSDKDRREIAGKEDKTKSKTKPREASKSGPSLAEKENAPPPPITSDPPEITDDITTDVPSDIITSEEALQGMLPQADSSLKSEVLNEDDSVEMEAIPDGFANEEEEPKSEEPTKEDSLLEGDHFNELGATDPSDSGVGSLESPKNSAKAESLPNAAEQKAASPVPIPPTPGPRPGSIKAYHPDLPETELEQSDNLSSGQPEDLPERPKTGMGIRPRTGRKSARPPSARPAPPKVREKKEIPPEEMPRPPTGKPITTLILDSDNKNGEEEEKDDDNFTVGNTESILIDDTLTERVTDPELEKNKQELLEGDQDAKGILVVQILETKKELEDNRREAFSPETPGHRRVPLEQTFQGDASRRKEKELIQKDVEKLTSSIQALTRSVNPLAKMLDYLQEDFDSMQKELESWRRENKTLEQNLKAEQSLTEQQLEPLKTQLKEMDAAIFDQRDRISAIKSVILRNEERSARLLAGININS